MMGNFISATIGSLDQYLLIPRIPLHCDDTAALPIEDQEGFNERTKHIFLKYNYIPNLRLSVVLSHNYLLTSKQVAKILTKPVDKDTLPYLRLEVLTDIRQEFDD